MRFRIAVPTTATTVVINGLTVNPLPMAQRMARTMGPAYQFANDTVAAADLLTFSAHLQYENDLLTSLLDEAFLDTTTYLVAEYEAQLGLTNGSHMGLEMRRRRLVAKWRALRGGTPQALASAVTALLDTPDYASVAENQIADVTAVPENIFLFAVIFPTAYHSDPNVVTAAREALDEGKPAHTNYVLTNQVGFLTDDPESLTDLTVLGT